MKRLKKKLSNMRSALSVRTHRMPRTFIIITMLAINIVILLVAALIALIIDDTFTSYLEALALGSVTWLLAPNAILEIENPQTLFLAVTVLLIGIILFSGTIIALITNALKDYFEKKQNSSGKIYLKAHIVVLNYNNKVPELVADLLYVQSRKVTVLILADVDKRTVEEKIRSALLSKNVSKDKLKTFNVLIKKGDPLNKSELRDASILQSGTIIVMNDERFEKIDAALSAGDLNVIKILLTLGQMELKEKINIVSEVKDFETKEKILAMRDKVNSLKNYSLIPVCFDKRLGQIMAQTVIEKHTEDIYLSLFSFEGSEVYPLDMTDFETCLFSHTHAVPLEQKGDMVFALSDSFSHVKKKAESPIHETVPLKLNPLREKHHQTVIIVGHNNKRRYIEETFKAYETLHKSAFTLKHTSHEQLKKNHEALSIDDMTTVLLLSDDTEEDTMLDGKVIDSLLFLKKKHGQNRVHIIAELLDPKNDALIKDLDIDNTIISNKIISLLLGKLALFPRTESFYDDLLTLCPNDATTDDKSLHVQRADTLYDADFPLTFKNAKTFIISHYEASAKKHMPIGVVREGTVELFHGGLHEHPYELNPDDKVILYKL